MWKSILEINKPLDVISLCWASGVLLIGLMALLRSRPIIAAMRDLHYPPEDWWRKRGVSREELEKSLALYARLFGVVWILSGLFWLHWVLYHQY